MNILGINGGFRQGYQDVSACIVQDGKLIAAVEEERLSRVKFSPGKLPYSSIVEVLHIANITIRDIHVVAFHGETWGSFFDEKLVQYFESHFNFVPPIKRFHHHDCHAAGTYYASGFERALVFSMDNSGDGISFQIALGEAGRIRTVKRFERAQSLGFFYSLIAQYCGFKKDSDEYKLMGLAAYGDKNKFDFSWLLNYNEGEYLLNDEFITTVPDRTPALHKDEMNFNEAFIAKMAQGRRLPHEPITSFYKDVAASAQHQLEKVVLSMLYFYANKLDCKNLCTSGGVALNCLMNSKIMSSGLFDNFYVLPASSDAGISIGAGWLSCIENQIKPVPSKTWALGSSFTNEDIKKYLDTCRISYEYVDDPAKRAAHAIAESKVIGWFQGASEFGPRALGNRSILASPSLPNIQNLVNNKIKFRDGFRPFGASVLFDDAKEYFEGMDHLQNYMTINYRTKQKYKIALQGVTHVDGTCRIHKVTSEENYLYHSLLQNLKDITGIGICLNTSFNLNYEPIVNSPQHALATFYGSGLDELFIGNYLIKK